MPDNMEQQETRLICYNCGYEERSVFVDDKICPECGKVYLLPRGHEKETPGRRDDHKFMEYNSPEKPLRDFLTKKIQWDCPTCKRPNYVVKKVEGKQICVCAHCGNVVRVRMGGSVRRK